MHRASLSPIEHRKRSAAECSSNRRQGSSESIGAGLQSKWPGHLAPVNSIYCGWKPQSLVGIPRRQPEPASRYLWTTPPIERSCVQKIELFISTNFPSLIPINCLGLLGCQDCNERSNIQEVYDTVFVAIGLFEKSSERQNCDEVLDV